jgi:cysteine synthase
MNKLKPITSATNPYTTFYIKDESANLHGTVKDRRNISLLTEADRLKVDKLVLITSGNNGWSLCQLAKPYGIKVVCIVDRELSPQIKDLLRSVAYQLIEVNLNHKILRPEEIVSFARETDEEVIWDVTNGYEAYYDVLAQEILHEVQPSTIVVPVGSGSLFVGMLMTLERLSPNTKLLGVGVQQTHHSMADKLNTPWTPYKKSLETAVQKGHSLIRLTEEDVKRIYTRFQHVVYCEPSSAVVFFALEHTRPRVGEITVLVNTGRLKLAQ